MTATTDRCPGCHGSGIEMSGVTYAGMSEYVGCHECGPGCPDDCGCRVGPERHESVAPRHPGATQSPDGSQGATEGLRGAESAVTDAEAAEWGALADAVTEGSWTASGRTVLGDGYGAEYVSIPDTPADAAFIALARTAVPRLLADRERLTGEASRVPVLLADKAALMGDVDRLTAERDGARLTRVIATRALTVSAALLETEIAKRESAEMRANRATADLDALESEDRRQDVQAKHWREVLRIRRELDGIRREMNDVTEIIAEALGYRPSGLPLDGWPHLSTTGDHTPTSLAAEAAGVLAKASRLRAGIEALADEWGKAGPGTEAERVFGRQKVSVEFAVKALRALLAEGGE